MDQKTEHTIKVLTAAMAANLRLIRDHRNAPKKYSEQLAEWRLAVRNCEAAIKDLRVTQGNPQLF